jgi:hypothetical protein
MVSAADLWFQVVASTQDLANAYRIFTARRTACPKTTTTRFQERARPGVAVGCPTFTPTGVNISPLIERGLAVCR